METTSSGSRCARAILGDATLRPPSAPNSAPPPHRRLPPQEAATAFEVTLVPDPGADEETNHVSIAMRVAYTPTYPEAAPELSLRAVRRGCLTDDLVAECEELLRQAAAGDELLGTAMVYALAEKAQEWLCEHNKPEMDMHTEMMERLAAQEAASGAAQVQDDVDEAGGGGTDAASRRRRKPGEPEGSWRKDPVAAPVLGENCTPVTPETFAAWRAGFNAKKAAEKAAAASKSSGGGGRNRVGVEGGEQQLTGRQLFERSGVSLVDDAGDLEDGEEDIMSAPRVAAPGGSTDGAGGSGGEAAGTAVLDAVGDEALFDDDEDLPDDEDEDEDEAVTLS